MKTFKKSLCLVLALVMVLGLCMVGANAGYEEYTDIETVAANEYADAINLVTDLKYMEGDEGGFRPEDGLTRAEAAKLITYMVLDADAAKAFGEMRVTSAPFEDVAASFWAASYISFCKQRGFIAGYGDGNFGPGDKLTGIQFAKMLLATKGYGAKGEYVGEGWDVAVWTDATIRKLLISGVDTAAQVKRGEAAQYIANTLMKVPAVTVESNGQYKDGQTYAQEKAITTNYAVVIANAATDGNVKGLTTVALFNGKDYKDAITLPMTGIPGDENLIGHELQITYKAGTVGTCYISNDVTSVITAADFAKDPNGAANVAFQFHNFKAGTATDMATIVKYATGSYAKISADYLLGYIASYTAADAAKGVLEQIAVVYGGAEDVAVVYGSFAKTDVNSYVKLYQVGTINKATILETKEVTLTSSKKDASGNTVYNGLALAGVPFVVNAVDTQDKIALGNTVTMVMVANGVYAGLVDTKAAEVDTNEYVYVVKNYTKESTTSTEYSSKPVTTNWVQCINAAGEVVNYQTKDAFTYTGVYALSSETDKGVTYTAFKSAGDKVVCLEKADFKATKATVGSANYYFDSAAVQAFKGELDTLKVSQNTSFAANNFKYAYAIVSNVRGNIYNINTAWLTEAVAVVDNTKVANSYIYITDADVKNPTTVWTEAGNVTKYNFYLDGVLTADQLLAAPVANGGYYLYSVNNGVYTLDNTGVLAAVVTVNKTSAAYILNGKLTDSANSFDEDDISALKVVDLRKNASITTIAELADAALTNDGVVFTVMYTKVEAAGVVNATPFGVIYVIG